MFNPLTISLMKYLVRYVSADGDSFSYISFSPEVYDLLRSLEKCDIKSFTVSFAETAQKGGSYER